MKHPHPVKEQPYRKPKLLYSYNADETPHETLLRYFRRRLEDIMKDGDVIVVDPECPAGHHTLRRIVDFKEIFKDLNGAAIETLTLALSITLSRREKANAKHKETLREAEVKALAEANAKIDASFQKDV